jgi:hypothetical protein
MKGGKSISDKFPNAACVPCRLTEGLQSIAPVEKRKSAGKNMNEE